jgi:hypothetical protein
MRSVRGATPGESRFKRPCPHTRGRTLVFHVVQARGDDEPLAAHERRNPRLEISVAHR